MAWWRSRGRDKQRRQELLEGIRSSAHNPPRMVFWCEKAVASAEVRAEPRTLAIVRFLYARALHDLDDGNQRANFERAIEVLEESVAETDPRSADESHVEALHELGLLYKGRVAGDVQANLERSIECHRRVLELTKAPDRRGMAAYELGRRYRARVAGERTANLDAAIANFRIAVDAYTQSGEAKRRAAASSALARALRERGTATDEPAPGGSAQASYELGIASSRRAGDQAENHEAALRQFQQARRAADPRTDPELWSNINHALGITYSARDRGDRAENIERAIEHLTEALRYLDQKRNRGDWQITQQTLAAAYDYRLAGDHGANLDRAVEHLTAAIAAGGRGDDPRQWAMLHQSLGLVYLKRAQKGSPQGDRRQDLQLAEAALNEVLSIRTRSNDPAGWARATQILAIVQQEQAQKADIDPQLQKIALLRASIEASDRSDDPEGWARGLVMLEDALEADGRTERQDEHWEERAQLLQGALTVHTVDNNPDLCAGIALRLGNALAALDRWEEALDAFTLAVDAGDSRYSEALTVLSRRQHVESTASAARLASYCLAKVGRLTDAVLMLERGRARALGDTLERDYGRLDELERSHPQLHRFYKDAAERLRRIQDAEHPSGDAGEVLTGLAGRMRTGRESLDSAVRRIRRTPGFEDFLEPPGEGLLEEVVRDDAPLAYLNLTPWGSLTLLVTKTPTIEITPLRSSFTEADMNDILHRSASAESIFPLMAGYLRLLYNVVESHFPDGNSALTDGVLFNDPGTVHRAGREELHRLDVIGRKLVKPLTDALGHQSRVILVPSGLLALVPLHTIPYDEHGCTLIDDVPVSFAPSARVLRHARERAARTTTDRRVLAGVGNPLPHPQPLWFATRELSEIAKLFDESHCLYGENVTKDRLLNAARSATHVHLACHGAAPFSRSEAPFLEFSDGDRFTVHEIARRRPFPSARMVVLSACQSALVGSFQLADEEMGLPTAVMLSGTPGVIGTLWAVNDLPTSLLMEHFYELLLGPTIDPWEALGRSQRWLSRLTADDVRRILAADPSLRRLAEENRSRTPGVESLLAALDDAEGQPFADPYYWAPFVYVGE